MTYSSVPNIKYIYKKEKKTIKKKYNKQGLFMNDKSYFIVRKEKRYSLISERHNYLF